MLDGKRYFILFNDIFSTFLFLFFFLLFICSFRHLLYAIDWMRKICNHPDLLHRESSERVLLLSPTSFLFFYFFIYLHLLLFTFIYLFLSIFIYFYSFLFILFIIARRLRELGEIWKAESGGADSPDVEAARAQGPSLLPNKANVGYCGELREGKRYQREGRWEG